MAYGFGARELRERVLQAFPDIGATIDEGDGIHLVMGALDHAIMNAAERSDLLRARGILGFVDTLLDRADLDPEIPNAVCISFIEPAELEQFDTGRQLWEEMSPRIRSLVLENKNRAERPGQ